MVGSRISFWRGICSSLKPTSGTTCSTIAARRRSGVGNSLREVLRAANDNVGADTIEFSLPGQLDDHADSRRSSHSRRRFDDPGSRGGPTANRRRRGTPRRDVVHR